MTLNRLLWGPGVVLGWLLSTTAAQAGQDGFVHPRRAWVVGSKLEAPAILLGPRVAWVSAAGAFERVCAGQAGCMPVIHWEPTGSDRLPRGFVLYMKRPGLSLSLPAWRDSLGWQLGEARAMAADPVLRPLARALESWVQTRMAPMHDPPLGIGGRSTDDRSSAPAAWVQKGQGPWHWELGFSLDPGVWSDMLGEDEDGQTRFLYGGTLRLGFRYQGRVGAKGSGGCIDDLLAAIWELLVGNQWGADLRLHAWREGDRTRFGIGLQPAVRLVWDDHGSDGQARIRTFSIFGLYVPEVGVSFDNHGDSSMYLRFVAPLAIMLTPDLALDIRLGGGFTFLADRNGAMGTLGLGLLFR